MAKMFYTIEEASQALGISPDQVKQLAAGGKIQQFRDRDKLMFKRDQVDALAQQSAAAPAAPTEPPPLPSTADSAGPISLAGSGDTDAIDLAADQAHPAGGRREDARHATGISVFDAGEITPADPMAQTQVTAAAQEEDLALASVGSGSGLLDLTRESDDTSLGAEFLDEIYPAEGKPGAPGLKMEVPGGGSGVMDSAMSSEVSGASGLENLRATAGVSADMVPADAYDPGGSGLGVGALLGVSVALFILGIVAVSALLGGQAPLVASMATDTNSVMMITGGLIVGSLVLGGIGYFVGAAVGRR